MKATIIGTQEGDWEALFIDGVLIAQGHSLGEGDPARFWLDIAQTHGVKAEDVTSVETDDEDEELLMAYGQFSEDFNISKYED